MSSTFKKRRQWLGIKKRKLIQSVEKEKEEEVTLVKIQGRHKIELQHSTRGVVIML